MMKNEECSHKYSVTGKCEWEGNNKKQRKVLIKECQICHVIVEEEVNDE